jgi:hypothetical protein
MNAPPRVQAIAQTTIIAPALPAWTAETAGAESPGLNLEYRPPPVECLPPPLAAYVAKSAEAIGCDPALVAMPALAACAAAIGDSRALLIKDGWMEFPVIWTLVVAPSGAMKTPAMKAAMEGLEALQRDAFDRYSANLAGYKLTFADWHKAGRQGSEPTPPKLMSYYIGDATLEAVCARLADNPRGLLQKRDELSGWLGSFDKYSDGNEAAQWLEFHSANSLRIDRKGGDTPTIYIPRALVSVTGTIQEKILRKMLTADEAKHFDNGMAGRFQMAMPPERTREWREASTPPELQKQYAELFRDLLALTPEIDAETGRREPRLIKFSPAAKEIFVNFVNMHGKEMHAFKSDRLKSAWAKMEAQAARLALIFHCIRQAYLPGPENNPDEISADTLKMGLAWVDWLKNETRRIYYTFANGSKAGLADRLIDFVRRNDGQATPRDAARVGAGGRTADEVEKLMCSLVASGFGEFISPEQPKGGRPTQYFRLKPVFQP